MTYPTVTVAEGTLKGCERTDLDGNAFYSFLGIPFAKPPVGDLRFKAAEPVEPWTGIKDATVDGDACYQRHDYLGHIEGSEDCLHLNIYTQKLPQDADKLKPVLVFIHGGCHVAGSNNSKFHGPEFLMTEDIVLVSINYRVGFFGFLRFDDISLDVPGNAGIKDQQLALKWIQTNIKNFNGDPSNVTIFGESGGGVFVHYHIVSPSSKGLFHKAILQSGCLLNPFAYAENYSLELAKTINKNVETEEEALRVLKNVPVDELFAAQEYIYETYGGIGSIGPNIEKPNKTAMITSSPIQLISSGQYNKVPILVGYCNKEGMLGKFLETLLKRDGTEPYENFLKVNVETLLPKDMSKEHPKYKLVSQKINDIYLKEPFAADKYQLATDYYFIAGLITTAKLHAKTSPYPVYLYRMSLDAGLNLLKRVVGVTDPGACHADDIGYLFNVELAASYLHKGEIEEKAIRRFVKLWTNFAKTGNPTPEENDLNVAWKPLVDQELNFLEIGRELTLKTDPESERMEVWKHIYQLNPKLLKKTTVDNNR